MLCLLLFVFGCLYVMKINKYPLFVPFLRKDRIPEKVGFDV